MPDPIITGAMAAAGKLSDRANKEAGLIKRVLGPPADALGEMLARWFEFRTQNVGRILESANERLGDRGDLPGRVPLRIAGRIFEEGGYCDDEVMQGYLGGLLASARTTGGRDDRAAKWTDLVIGLSRYEVRMHYLLYTTARETYVRIGQRTAWGRQSTGQGVELWVVLSMKALAGAMDFIEDETQTHILGETLATMLQSGLIRAFTIRGTDDFTSEYGRQPPYAEVLMFQPSTMGVLLFLWAQGLGTSDEEIFDDPGAPFLKLGARFPHGHRFMDLPPVEATPSSAPIADG